MRVLCPHTRKWLRDAWCLNRPLSLTDTERPIVPGGTGRTIYCYINEWNRDFVSCKLPLKTWSCLLLTYAWMDDAGTMRLYLNGKLVDEKAELPPMRRNDAPLCIGATRWGEAGWCAHVANLGCTCSSAPLANSETPAGKSPRAHARMQSLPHRYAWHGAIGPLTVWNQCLKGQAVVIACLLARLHVSCHHVRRSVCT